MSSVRDWSIYDRPALRDGFAGAGSDRRGTEVVVALDGMHCAACVGRARRQLDGRVLDLRINLAARTARFRHPAAGAPLSVLLAALDGAGLEPRILAADGGAVRAVAERRRLLLRIGIATVCSMQVMMLAWPTWIGTAVDAAYAPLLRWAQLVFSIPGVLWAGAPFFRNAVRALQARSLDMDVPVALALAAAFGASAWRVVAGHGELYFDTATMFVWFLTVGRWLEGRTRARAGERLRLLAGRRALTAQRRRADGGLETLAIEQLANGDIAVVMPGETLPADGRLCADPAELDEALLTGEARPVVHGIGGEVLAGAINVGARPLELVVERTGDDTVLAGITRLLDGAQASRPPLQQIADRIAGRFIATVLVLAAVGAALAVARGSSGEAAFGIALAVLVASCPCALSLAVPVALAAASSRLARAGVLTANAGALTPLADIDTVLFDKTGTLTVDTLQRIAVVTADDLAPDAATAIAAALERGSRHPIARAFADCDEAAPATGRVEVAGRGVEGIVAGQRWHLGATEDPPPAALTRQAGDTVIALRRDGAARPSAWFLLRAPLRHEALAAVTALRARGLAIELQSGDAAEPVAAVAAALGIPTFGSRRTPADKLARLQALRAQGRRVLAVGDGLNDAPLLAAADVSAALPHGAALTQARADLLLTAERLTLLPLAIEVAQATRARVRENLVWALGYNALVLPLAMAGMLPAWLAAAGMSASSLVVVANALRLERAGGEPVGAQPASGSASGFGAGAGAR